MGLDYCDVPDSEQLTPAEVAEIVREARDEWGQDPCDINQGACLDFAAEIARQIPCATTMGNEEMAAHAPEHTHEPQVIDGDLILGGGPEHAWVYHRGRHYDAEAPDGVDCWTDLPFFTPEDGQAFTDAYLDRFFADPVHRELVPLEGWPAFWEDPPEG